ncbi:MAG: DUF2141 domain-containing protein [Proteobacteria bacterium]|nr:DUF2141 domain-containing protein [Pseudomonadota bacterium]
MMKLLCCGLLVILAPMVLFAVEMTFIVEGVKNDSGSVYVGVYNSAETFTKKGKHVTGCISKIEAAGKAVTVVCKVDSGTYAAAVFHDENNNSELDKNFMGIPKENYGFSNNASGMFGPPDFADAAFEVGNENLEMNIKIK